MQVFISHSTKDLETVYKLGSVLQINSIHAVVAESVPQPGTYLSEKIKGQIQSSDCVLAVLTKDGTRSEWVNQELGMAEMSGKRIIPLVENGVQVKGVLEGREYIPFDKQKPETALSNAVTYLQGMKTSIDNRNFIGSLILLGLVFGAFSNNR